MSQLTRDEILSFLEESSLMVLSTANTSGQPHGSVLLFSIDDNFCITFVTYPDTEKSKYLTANPQAAVTVGFGPPFNVQAKGTVALVSDEEEKNAALESLSEKALKNKDFWPPIFHISKNTQYNAYKFRPSWLRCLDLRKKSISLEESPFTELNI